MPDYVFSAPPEVVALCDHIAERMVRIFGISRSEAVARINCHWRGQTFDERNDLVLHASKEHWALRIYYREEIEDGQLVRYVRERPAADSGCWTLTD